MNRKCITKWDIAFICVILLVVVALLLLPLLRDRGGVAVVRVGERTVAEFPLHTDIEQRMETDDGFNTVVVRDGVCFVTAADCRDGICMGRGAISKVGESIVCLPHKLIVEIEAK